jgi:large exoprotein involved in heme utilization and adhesion
MNPAGVLFGEGSSIDVPGALHVTTADYLRHADAEGTRFPATAEPPSALSIAPIEAFGFLDDSVAPLGVQDTVLRAAPGQALSLVGGDTEILRGSERVPGGNLAILLQGGPVHLVAVASPGEVSLDDGGATPRPDVESFERLGGVRMERAAILSVGAPAGEVVVQAEDMLMQPGRLIAWSLGPTDDPGVGVDIALRGTLRLERLGGVLTVPIAGPAGDVVIEADAIVVGAPAATIIGSGTIFSGFGGAPPTAGPPGAVEIRTGLLEITGGGAVATDTPGPGPGGPVTIHANEIRLSSGGAIATTPTVGPAGDITIEADAIFLRAGGEEGLDGPGSGIFSGVFPVSDGSVPVGGAPGGVELRARLIEVRGPSFNGSVVGGSASAQGPVVIAADELRMIGSPDAVNWDVPIIAGWGQSAASGDAASIEIHARSILLVNSVVSAESDGSGDSGDVRIVADDLTLLDGGAISSGIVGSGAAGDTLVTANRITVSGSSQRRSGLSPELAQSSIFAGTFGPTQEPGRVVITADELLVEDNGVIGAGASAAAHVNAFGPGIPFPERSSVGDAGQVVIDAGRITLRGGGSINTITADDFFDGVRYTAGRGGSIDVTTDELVLLDGGQITASSFGSGDAGEITIRAPSILISGVAPEAPLIAESERSQITASTFALGEGGSVDVEAGELTLRDGGAISTITRSAVGAPGGDVTVRANRVTVAGTNVTPSGEAIASGIRASSLPATELPFHPDVLPPESVPAGPTTGNAGSVNVVASDVLRVENGGTIEAFSELTDAGDVTIQAGHGVELLGGSITTEVNGGEGTTGGNIKIDPDWVVLQNGSRIAANAYEGQGGNIDITTRGLFVSSDSVISASSEFGVSGTVQVNAPDTNLAGSLAPLSERYLEEARLRRDRCETLGREDAGSFVLGVGAGLPEPPDAALPSFGLEHL